MLFLHRRMDSMNKEMRQLVKAAEDQGWTLDRNHRLGNGGKRRKRRHPRLVPPGGGDFIVIPDTPSDRRSYLNTRALLRRAGLEV